MRLRGQVIFSSRELYKLTLESKYLSSFSMFFSFNHFILYVKAQLWPFHRQSRNILLFKAIIPKHSKSLSDITSHILIIPYICENLGGFSDGAVVKNLPANSGDLGSIPGSGRAPGEGNGNPLHYSCLENSMDRAAWRVTTHGVTKRVKHDLATKRFQNLS